MRHSILLLMVLAPLGCADGESSWDASENIGSKSSALVIRPASLWNSPVRNVCFAAETHEFSSTSSSLCVKQFGSGAAVQLATCDGSDAQDWTVEITDIGTIHSAGLCLQPAGGVATNLAQVEVVACNGSAAQRWDVADWDRLTPRSGPTPTLCITPTSGTSGAGLQLEPCADPTGDPAKELTQHWRIPKSVFQPEHRRIVRDAITNTWGAVTNIDLNYWQTCPDDLSTLGDVTVIFALRGGRAASPAEFRHDPAPATLAHAHQDWNRGGAVHEWGHVMGLQHEQNRLDNQPQVFCNRSVGYDAATIDYGPYDPESAMNYCGVPIAVNETETGYANLSLNDVRGSQTAQNAGGQVAYGAREYRRGVWSAGIVQQTNLQHDPNQALVLQPGMAWASVDGRVELRFSLDGHLGVYRTDLTYSNDSGGPPLPPLWQAKDSTGNLITGTAAIFGTDGNLSILSVESVVWSVPGTPLPGSTLSIQHDGNVVLWDQAGNAVWATQTSHRDPLLGAAGLIPGATLAAGQSKFTDSGRFELAMQADGNLVVYDLGPDRLDHGAVWSTNTAGSGAQAARMMLDGTLALLNASGARVWTAPFVGSPGNFLALQDNGNLVVYEPSKFEVWRAETPNECVADWRSTNAGQLCVDQTQWDRAQCGVFLDCYFANDCGPATCGAQDDVCGVNVIGNAGMAPKTIADEVFSAMGCPAAGPGEPGTIDPNAGEPNACLADWRSSDAGQSCLAETQWDRAQCDVFLDCYYDNGCSPATCGGQDDVCGVNVIGNAGMAPKTIADDIYNSLDCPAVVSSTPLGTEGAFQPTFDAPPVMLWRDSTLNAGESLSTESGRAVLNMGWDGALTFSVDGRQVWSTGPRAGWGFQARLTYNGDLQVTNANDELLYRSETDFYMNSYLTFTDSGTLSIYRVVTQGVDGVGFDF